MLPGSRRALSESEYAAAITALTALAAADTASHAAIAARLSRLGLGKGVLIEDWLYLVQVCLDKADAASRQALLPLVEQTNRGIDRRVAEISLRLDATDITSRIMTMMRWSADSQHERIYYLYLLRHTTIGWTPELRREYFTALNGRYIGGRGLPGFIKQIRKDATATLSEVEKTALGELLQGKVAPAPELKPRKFVRNWTMQDLQAALDKSEGEGNLKNGRELFDQALCSRCHRFKDHGGVVGPDLTYVNRRFTRKDLLESIIEPSSVVGENYRIDEVELVDGKILTGQIIPQLDYRKTDVLVAKDPLDLTVVEAIPKAKVKAHRKSKHSIMPPALLNTLTEEDILDLLHWLEQ
jgi:putative heme-binding domain-containing protein